MLARSCQSDGVIFKCLLASVHPNRTSPSGQDISYVDRTSYADRKLITSAIYWPCIFLNGRRRSVLADSRPPHDLLIYGRPSSGYANLRNRSLIALDDIDRRRPADMVEALFSSCSASLCKHLNISASSNTTAHTHAHAQACVRVQTRAHTMGSPSLWSII